MRILAILLRAREVRPEGEDREEPRRAQEGIPKGHRLHERHPGRGRPRPLPHQLRTKEKFKRELPRRRRKGIPKRKGTRAQQVPIHQAGRG